MDFGESGTKESSAQLTALYTADDLVGRLVLAVTNFPPRQIASVRSEVLVLGLPTGVEGEVALIQPDRDIPLGSRVF
ncbi:MAG TPA: tRNA-binding protein [Chloroflexota bacterium]